VTRQLSDRPRASLALFLGIYALLSILLFDPKLFTGGDNAVYLILGRSLAQGTGYTNVHLPGSPPHADYPPGLPLMLAGLFKVTGFSIFAAKLLVMAFGLGAMAFIFLIMRNRFGDRANLPLTLTLSIPILVNYNHWVMTEIPFLCVSMAAVWCLLEFDEGREQYIWPAFGLAVFGMALRTAGLTLVLGIGLLLIVRRRYELAALLFALTLVLFSLLSLRGTGGSTYISQLLSRDPYFPEFGRAGPVDLLLRVWRNVRIYAFAVLPHAMTPVFMPGPAATVLAWAVILPLVFGVIRRGRRLAIVETYSLAALSVLLLWPEPWADERFLLPFLPLVIIYMCQGLYRLGQGRRRWVPAAVVGIFLALNVYSLQQQVRTAVRDNRAYLAGDRYAGYRPDWRRWFEAIDWLRQHVRKDKVVLARKPEFVYLLSGRKSFCYPFTDSLDRVHEALLESDFVIVDNFGWTESGKFFLNPVLDQYPGLYSVVYQTGPPEFSVLSLPCRRQPAHDSLAP